MSESYTREDIPVMDLERIKSLFGINEGFFERVVDAFLQSAPVNVEGIATSFREGDFDSLRKYSHTLKGASGNIGGARLSAVCADLEAAVRDGEGPVCPVMVESMVSCYNQLVDELQKMLVDSKNS